MTPDELRALRASRMKEMETLIKAAENTDSQIMNDTQLTRFGDLEAEVQTLDKQIGITERHLARGNSINNAPEVAPIRSEVGTQKPDSETGISCLGEFVYLAAFRPNDDRIRALSTDTGSGGGYTMPGTMSPGIKQLSIDKAIFRKYSTAEPVNPDRPDDNILVTALDQGTDEKDMYAGIKVQYIEDRQTAEESDFDLRQVMMKPRMAQAIMFPSKVLLRNWKGADAKIRTLFGMAHLGVEEQMFYSGNGKGKPLGIVNSPARIIHNRKFANRVVYDDCVQLITKGRTGITGGRFIASEDLRPEFMTMEDSAGNLIWQPSAREGEPDRLLGRPLHWSERSRSKGVEGDLIYADLGYNLVTEGYPMAITASEHEKFSKGVVVVKLDFGHDARPWLQKPVVNEGGRVRSPFVVLGVPA